MSSVMKLMSAVFVLALSFASFAAAKVEHPVGCYYYWVDERVDPVGVKKDLEWMKSVGITKAFLATDIRNYYSHDRSQDKGPYGKNAFMSDHWWTCLETALVTAGELGIEMGLFNCPGWSQSGGPWVKKEDAHVKPDGSMPVNSPCSPAATGYEVSKTDRAAVRRHFDAFIGEIIRRIPAEKRKTLTTVVIDSWERGRVRKPEGDPRELSDIIAEEYVGELTRCAHEHGLKTWCEPYSHSPDGWDAKPNTYGAAADMSAAEFWVNDRKFRTREMNAAISSARLRARRAGDRNTIRVYAESFTDGRWEKFAQDDWTFEKLKPIADTYRQAGVTDFILHVVISQPGDDKEPPVRPWFGSFFDRRSAHASEMKTLVDYLLKITNERTDML